MHLQSVGRRGSCKLQLRTTLNGFGAVATATVGVSNSAKFVIDNELFR